MSGNPFGAASGGPEAAPPSDAPTAPEEASSDEGAARVASDGAATPGPSDDCPGKGTSSAPAEGELVEPGAIEDELAALIEKAARADEYLALAQRTQADFENYRKRTIRDAKLAQERGIAKLAKELLPAVDNLERALSAAQGAAATAGEDHEVHGQLVSGMQLVHADVISALQRAGIEGFSPVGEPFDPQWHEAVAQAPVPGAEPGSVVEVYQRGYKFGETVLRPARVLVAA
jgi:molecular chaperone GrpE